VVIEIAIVFVIFTTATWLGFRAVPVLRANGVVQAFYQSSFGPAVMVACGREFREPDVASVPPLAAFLAEQTDSFECAALPASTRTFPLNSLQGATQYCSVLSRPYGASRRFMGQAGDPARLMFGQSPR
jgi:hypothetical protein